MIENQYEFWVKWRLGLISRELTKEEASEIRASEFAMNLLVPKPVAEQLIDTYSENILESKIILEMVADALAVPYEAVVFQLQDVLKQKKLERTEGDTVRTK